MMINKYVIVFFLSGLFLSACDNDDEFTVPDGDISFYLAESFDTKPNTAFIIKETVQLEEEPFITYNDIVSYNSETYEFQLSDSAAHKIKDDYSVLRKAFAILANGEIIYTGYFWASYMSSSCDWIIVDILTITNDNHMKIEKGYPSLIEGVKIPDERNNKLLLGILIRDQKLK